MKPRFIKWWNILTSWAIAQRQEWRDAAHDDVVLAIMLRRAQERTLEKDKLATNPRER